MEHVLPSIHMMVTVWVLHIYMHIYTCKLTCSCTVCHVNAKQLLWDSGMTHWWVKSLLNMIDDQVLWIETALDNNSIVVTGMSTHPRSDSIISWSRLSLCTCTDTCCTCQTCHLANLGVRRPYIICSMSYTYALACTYFQILLSLDISHKLNIIYYLVIKKVCL